MDSHSKDCIILTRHKYRMIAEFTFWLVPGATMGVMFILLGTAIFWQWPAFISSGEREIVTGVIGFICGMFLLPASIYMMSCAITRRVMINSNAITEIYHPFFVGSTYRKSRQWDQVQFVHTTTVKGKVVPSVIMFGSESKLNLASNGFKNLNLAMPLIKKHLPADRIDLEESSIAELEDIDSTDVTLRPPLRNALPYLWLIAFIAVPWLPLIWMHLAAQHATDILVQQGLRAPSNRLENALNGMIPVFFILGLQVIYFASAAVKRLKQFVLISSRGITLLVSSHLSYQKQSKLYPWEKILAVYTTKTSEGTVPAEIHIAGGTKLSGLERYIGALESMSVICRYAPSNIIKSWDFPSSRTSTDIDIALSETRKKADDVILRNPIPYWPVWMIGRSLAIPALSAWIIQDFVHTYNRFSQLLQDAGDLSSLAILHSLVGLVVATPVAIVIGLLVRDFRRIRYKCIVNSEGLTFMHGGGKLGKRMYEITIGWNRVREVFIFDYPSGKRRIPAEIVFDDGSCIHLTRFLDNISKILDTIERNIPAEKIKPWYSLALPPGVRLPKKN